VPSPAREPRALPRAAFAIPFNLLLLFQFNFNFIFIFMKTVTMLEFRKNAARLLRRIANGERFVLSHRGKPAARLEPVHGPPAGDPSVDPFLTIGRRATASRRGKTKHADIDRILYGRG